MRKVDGSESSSDGKAGRCLKYDYLVIFSQNVGLGFSGGSDATINLIAQISHQFKTIHVVAQNLGRIPFETRNHVVSFEDNYALKSTLLNLHEPRTLFFGDFKDAVILADLQLPYVFVYHDNWPEVGPLLKLSTLETSKSLKSYSQIFKSALCCFSVSKNKLGFISKYNKHVVLLPNGPNLIRSLSNKNGNQPICKWLMIGNIDARKYAKAIAVFKKFQSNVNIRIDIYGHVMDQDILKSFQEFSFVSIKKYEKEIALENYHALLSCSLMENSPISIIECLYARLPVIAFDVGGISELVTPENGILIEPYDTARMAKVITEWSEEGFSGNVNIDKNKYNWASSGEVFIKQLSNL